MFTRIYIDNYRCFSNFELHPGRLTLILGPNGGGKSSLFHLLNAVVLLTRFGASIEAVFPPASRTRWDTRHRQRVEFEVDGSAGRFRYELSVLHREEDSFVSIERETVHCGDRRLFTYEDGQVTLHRNDGAAGASFPFRGSRSFLAQIERRPETKDLVQLLDFLEGVWTVRLDVRYMESTSQEEAARLLQDGSNFASWYRHLTQERPERLSELWSSLSLAIPGFKSLKLSSGGGRGRARDLVATLVTGDVSYDVEFHELSEGQRALVVLYTLLQGVVPERTCLLLDEPEAHVGLAEVQPWLTALEERFDRSGQVMVISHHPEVVDYLAAIHPVRIERPDGGPARAKEAMFDRSTGLTASQQIARGLTDAE